jgi:hypothetical protein
MSKGKGGSFRGPSDKTAAPRPAPQGVKRPAAPPPRIAVRPRGSAKGR